MKKEYVFHGSPVKVEKLIPNQACDIEYKEGCQYAVYATTNKIMAILSHKTSTNQQNKKILKKISLFLCINQ